MADSDLLKPPRVPEADRLYLSDWMWRPWYAKTLWAVSLILWGGAAIAIFVATLRPLYGSPILGILTGLSFPPLVAFVLGAGFVRAYFRDRIEAWEWEPVDFEEEERPWGRPSMGGRYNNPYFNRFDARSGPNWIGLGK